MDIYLFNLDYFRFACLQVSSKTQHSIIRKRIYKDRQTNNNGICLYDDDIVRIFIILSNWICMLCSDQYSSANQHLFYWLLERIDEESFSRPQNYYDSLWENIPFCKSYTYLILVSTKGLGL